MILVILFTLSVVSIIIVCNTNEWGTSNLVASMTCVVLIVTLIVASIVAGINYINKDADYAKLLERREVLVYQLENVKYNNTIDLYKKDLYDDICKFNEEIKAGRVYNHNIWVSVFYPIDYESIDLIEFREGS